jgi:hypothetical protein
MVERLRKAEPHLTIKRGVFGCLLDRLDAGLHGRERTRRERETVAGAVGKPVKRRLRVACAAERTRQIARLGAEPPALLREERPEQPQQSAPAFHLAPEVVHRLGVGAAWVSIAARLREDVAGDGAKASPTQTLPDA